MLEDDPAWARTAFWLIGAGYTVIIVLVVGLFILGLAVGPAPPDQPPAIDFDDSPRTVVETAIERLHYRDLTAVRWIERATDSGPVERRYLYRIDHEHSRGRVYGRLWLYDLEDEGATEPTEPALELWANRYGVDWSREPATRVWTRDRIRYGALQPSIPANWVLTGSAPYTVRVDNRTHFVTTVTETTGNESDTSATTVSVTIAKEPEAHLQRVVVRSSGTDSTSEGTLVIRNYRTATAPRPDPAAPVTIDELVGRSLAGLRRVL